MSFDREKVLKLCKEWSKNILMETLEIEYIVINRFMITSVIEDEVKAKIDTLINAKKYQSNKSKNRESH